MSIFLTVLIVMLSFVKVGHASTSSYADHHLLAIQEEKREKGLVLQFLSLSEAAFESHLQNLFLNPQQSHWKRICQEEAITFSGVNVYFWMNRVIAEVNLFAVLFRERFLKGFSISQGLQQIACAARQGMNQLLSGCWGIMDEEESKKYYSPQDIEMVRNITRSLGSYYDDLPLLEHQSKSPSPSEAGHYQAAEALMWEGWVPTVTAKLMIPDDEPGRWKTEKQQVLQKSVTQLKERNRSSDQVDLIQRLFAEESFPGTWQWNKGNRSEWKYCPPTSFYDLPKELLPVVLRYAEGEPRTTRIIVQRVHAGDPDPTDDLAFRKIAQNPLAYSLEEVKNVLLCDDAGLVRELLLKLMTLEERGQLPADYIKKLYEEIEPYLLIIPSKIFIDRQSPSRACGPNLQDFSIEEIERLMEFFAKQIGINIFEFNHFFTPTFINWSIYSTFFNCTDSSFSSFLEKVNGRKDKMLEIASSWYGKLADYLSEIKKLSYKERQTKLLLNLHVRKLITIGLVSRQLIYIIYSTRKQNPPNMEIVKNCLPILLDRTCDPSLSKEEQTFFMSTLDFSNYWENFDINLWEKLKHMGNEKVYEYFWLSILNGELSYKWGKPLEEDNEQLNAQLLEEIKKFLESRVKKTGEPIYYLYMALLHQQITGYETAVGRLMRPSAEVNKSYEQGGLEAYLLKKDYDSGVDWLIIGAKRRAEKIKFVENSPKLNQLYDNHDFYIRLISSTVTKVIKMLEEGAESAQGKGDSVKALELNQRAENFRKQAEGLPLPTVIV